MTESAQSKAMSLWVATAEGTQYSRLEEDLEVDVAVIGGGIAGLTAAYELKRRGLTVAVLEGSRIGTGVTGSTTGKVTSLHRLAYTQLAADHGMEAARAYGQANEAALAYIAATVEAEGLECGFRRVSNYTYAEAGGEHLAAVRAEAELAARLGLPASFTTDVPLPFATQGAVRFEDQAQFHAMKYLQGLARAVDGGDSVVVERTPVRAVHDGTPAVAVTDHGTVRAREIVVATNVPMGDGGRYSGRLTIHRSYIVASPADGLPADATFISADEPMRSILTTREDGTDYVLVGGEGHPAAEGDTGGGSAARLERLAEFSRERLGGGEPAYRWSTQDTLPVDGLPFAGPLTPDSRHLYVITGLRKWGLTNGTASALVVADAVTGAASAWAGLFDSTRKLGPASAQGRERAEAEAPLPPWRGLPRLAPGEGAVFDVGGKATAVYADAAGVVHALSARCTHLRCVVEFAHGADGAEPTWDCPCHGSRFALDGTVIQGPAEKDLAHRDMPD
ncbi:FAD-dependent oxidoreductase [Sinomonas sp. ASV486]|uniref:FAD-dependent oxidoreductase n=1 Tax=Sinomonas sp. ASV486 TaxID=3051170 RepID=UPI0027DE688F|nr:FAD-dependent oxidoreductase [Sinomonas sp. ASV486]MDQ4489296.1 FAD-dependent oxidoreductase [Sinomonas sp. ASV486]